MLMEADEKGASAGLILGATGSGGVGSFVGELQINCALRNFSQIQLEIGCCMAAPEPVADN